MGLCNSFFNMKNHSLNSNNLAMGTSRISAISNSFSREMEVFILGASMLLICVRLISVFSASCNWVSPLNFR